jgi:hypothetical protein
MKRKRGIQCVAALFLLCLSAAALSSQAQNFKRPSSYPVFSWSTDPDSRIISYSETPQMLANPDPIPRIQVFGDGWVWVHYPEYMTKAGDYEAYLSRSEIRELLQKLTGVFGFKPEAVGAEKKVINEARQKQSGIMKYRSEDTLEQIEVNVDQYRPNQRAAAVRIDLELTWKNISSDAREFPDIADLQHLDSARSSIRQLLERNDLARIETTPARD